LVGRVPASVEVSGITVLLSGLVGTKSDDSASPCQSQRQGI
jgi:hypothetical protein